MQQGGILCIIRVRIAQNMGIRFAESGVRLTYGLGLNRARISLRPNGPHGDVPFAEDREGRGLSWGVECGILTMSTYIRTPHEREKENLFTFDSPRIASRHAAPCYRRKNEDDSQCTLQRFYIINTDALARIWIIEQIRADLLGRQI